MSDDHDSELPRQLAFYHGVVTANADPYKLGRVRVRIPGMIDDQSGWAFPLGLARGNGVGFFSVPQVGAEVGVWFKHGDEDHPFYVPGWWLLEQQPDTIKGLSADEAPDVHVIETKSWALVLDDRAGRQNLLIKSKALDTDLIELDGVTHGVTIKGTVGVNIESLGAIRIQGTAVTINGRAVAPVTKPI